MNATMQKWLLGIISTLIASTIIGGLAWAHTVRADIATLQEQARTLDPMRVTLEQIRVDVAAIRARNESRDIELERRLQFVEERMR